MSSPRDDSSDGRPVSAQFHTTHWSVVLSAGEQDSSQAVIALERLGRAYWYPLYAYVRAQGHGPHDAEDLTQSFFAFLLERKAIGHAHPERGRFRSFLLAALKNFLADARDKACAQKRGGGRELLSLDTQSAEEMYRLEPVNTLTPDKIYERRWAITLMEQAMKRLRAEQGAAGTLAQFELLSAFLFDDSHTADYAQTSERLGLSRNGVAAAVSRLRKRYRQLIRSEIEQTVSQPSEIEDELQHLFAVTSD